VSQGEGDTARRVHGRDLTASLVAALCRMARRAAQGVSDEQALHPEVEEALALVNEYGQRTGRGVTILFDHDGVFVGGELLRGNRRIYEDALELGEVLRRAGAAELALARDVRAQDLYALATALAQAPRNEEPQVTPRPSPRVRLRGLVALASRIEPGAAPSQAVARAYASAVVVMRRIFDALRREKYELPRRFNRIAQRLCDLTMGEASLLVAATAARDAYHDEGRRAVDTAVLSLAMARQLTRDAATLSQIATAALLLNVGRDRIAGMIGQPISKPTVLDEKQRDRMPAGAAVLLTTLGHGDEASVSRAVIVYEAQRLLRQSRLGPPYQGLYAPTLQARIIAKARAYVDLLTPDAGQTPPSIDEVIAKLQQAAVDDADRDALRLLLSVLGVHPKGTLVELSTGELGLVLKTRDEPSLYARPRIRVVFDASGGSVRSVLEIDLAEPQRGSEPARQIRRVVASWDDSSTAPLRAFVAELAESPDSASSPRSSTSSSLRRHQIVPPTLPPTSAMIYGPLTRGLQPFSRPTTPKMRAARRDWTPPSPPRDLFSLIEPIKDDSEVPHAAEREEQPKPQRPEEGTARELMNPIDTSPSIERPRSTPTAEGTLARTPLINLLVYMLDQRLHGTVLFALPSGMEHAIYFHDGAPSKIRTGTRIATLDRVLIDLGMLDDKTLRGTLAEISKTRALHGRHLVDKGLLSGEALIKALRHQVLRKLMALFEMPTDARYAYYDGENLLASYGGPELTPCEPLAAIMAGARIRAGDPAIDATLLRIAGRPLALHPEADVERFHLQRDEQAVIELLRARRMTLGELQSQDAVEERIMRTTIYVLTITRHLDFGVPGRPPVGIGLAPIEDTKVAAKSKAPAGSAQLAEPSRSPSAAPSSADVASRPGGRGPMSTLTSEWAPPRVELSPSQASRTPLDAVVARPTTRMPRVTIASSSSPNRDASPSIRSTQGGSGEPSPARSEAHEPESSRSKPPSTARPTTRMPRVSTTSIGHADASKADASDEAQPASSQGKPPSSSSSYYSQIARRSAESSPPETTPKAPGKVAVAEKAPEKNATSESMIPTTLRSDIVDRRTEIERRARSINELDHFQTLGVARDATTEKIRAAYFSLAKLWHPDRLPSDLLDKKADVARIFARISDAYKTLSDEGKRNEYLAELSQGTSERGDEEKLARVVDAALEFQKAEILLKKNDLSGAEVLALRAFTADPEQPEYITLLVWIQSQRRADPQPAREGAQSTHLDDLIAKLDGVLEKDPRYERALYYRGILHKRAGRIDESIRDFRLAAEINPRNIDAAREVRIYEMRRRHADPHPPDHPEGGGSLLSKLFKR